MHTASIKLIFLGSTWIYLVAACPQNKGRGGWDLGAGCVPNKSWIIRQYHSMKNCDEPPTKFNNSAIKNHKTILLKAI
jgi:hypothetical protein